MSALLQKTCRYCGNDFHTNRSNAKYCSVKCRVAAWRERKKEQDVEAVMKDIQSGALGKLVFENNKTKQVNKEKLALQEEGKVMCPVCSGRGRYMGADCGNCDGNGYLTTDHEGK